MCCRAWGITPAEFDGEAEAGRIAAEDVLEQIRCESHACPELGRYLWAEHLELRKRKLENVRVLVMALRHAADEGERARLVRLIQKENR